MQCFSTIHAEITVSPNTPAAKWELDVASTRPDHEINHPSACSAARSALPLAKSRLPRALPGRPMTNPLKYRSRRRMQASSRRMASWSTAASTTRPRHASRSTRPSATAGPTARVSTTADLPRSTITPPSMPAPTRSADSNRPSPPTIPSPASLPWAVPEDPAPAAAWAYFFVAYEWTRNHVAETDSGLVPTEAERTVISQAYSTHSASRSPFTIPRPGCRIPAMWSPSARRPRRCCSSILAQHLRHPALQLPGARAQQHPSGLAAVAPGQDTWAAETSSMGGFNFQSTRASNENLFGFVDTTDTLGINTNINWSHRFSQRLFFYGGYRFSRLRTQIVPYFENRQNISGDAGITGNNQDPTNWGPPALTFSSGIAPSRTSRARSIVTVPMAFPDPSLSIAAATTLPSAAICASSNTTISSSRTRAASSPLPAPPPKAHPTAATTAALTWPTSSSACRIPAPSPSATRTSIFAKPSTTPTPPTTGASSPTSPSTPACAGTTARR
jgi:hypothetical protein